MCGECDKLFTNLASLSTHMYDHMKKRFKCKVCERGFYFEGQLKQHKIVHCKEGKGTFKCMTTKWGLSCAYQISQEKGLELSAL